MNTKFSKLDIGSMHKRVREKKVRHVIRREVRDRDFMRQSISFPLREAVEETPVVASIVLPKAVATKKKTKKVVEPQAPSAPFNWADAFAPAVFGLAVIAVVFSFRSLGYLGEASNASKEILGSATSAYTELEKATARLGSQNFNSAKGLFVSAQNNLRLAQEKLNTFQLLKIFAPQAQNADRMLTGASYLAEAGSSLTQAMALFEEFKVSSQGIETDDFYDKLAQNRELISQAKVLVDKAAVEFNSISSVPTDYADTLTEGKEQVSQLSTLLGKLLGLEDLYLGFFTKTPKTYLLIFQNYDEARATGGFIGTYGVLKVSNGKIDKLKIESIYNLDGQLYDDIAAPGPFQPAIPKWGMRDANWFADFPTSAEKLLYFYEKVGETADGVIAATPQIFSELLKLTGSIEMGQYGVTLTAENFQEQVQFKTSVDYDKELNEPKKFLADFAPIFLNRLTNLESQQWLDVFQIIQDSLSTRQILLYSKDKQVQDKLSNLGVSGEVLETEHDYLNIVNSNLGGTKTDLDVVQSVMLDSKFLNDGTVVNTLKITRDNTAVENNRSFMRVLVPEGSQFISAEGFDPYDFRKSESVGMKTDPDLAAWDEGQMLTDVYVRGEAGKTEFSGWVNTQGGTKRTVTITYSLPFRIGAGNPYSLLVQKQSGSKPTLIKGSWDMGKWQSAWTSSGVVRTGNRLEFESNSATDDFWGVVTKK